MGRTTSSISFQENYPNILQRKCISEVARIGSIIIFHLRKQWKAKFFILCDVIFLLMLQGKFGNPNPARDWPNPAPPLPSAYLPAHCRLVRWPGRAWAARCRPGASAAASRISGWSPADCSPAPPLCAQLLSGSRCAVCQYKQTNKKQQQKQLMTTFATSDYTRGWWSRSPGVSLKTGLHVRRKHTHTHKHKHKPRVNRDDTSARKRNALRLFLALVFASSRFTRGLCLCLRRTCKPALSLLLGHRTRLELGWRGNAWNVACGKFPVLVPSQPLVDSLRELMATPMPIV